MEHNRSKVTLSPFEWELVQNPVILLTKNEIIKKVYTLFGALAEDFAFSAKELPAEVIAIPPKISRGENYKGLPYVMLDYPRYFAHDRAFAIRTFFWWGNFFSITLQLEGDYLHRYYPRLQRGVKQSGFNGWFINAGGEKWQHHFEQDNYRLVASSDDLQADGFLKLAKKIPLQQWDELESILTEEFNKLVHLLH